MNVDLIERKKTPTREDALASRLKALRDAASPSTSPASSPAAPRAEKPSQNPSVSPTKIPLHEKSPAQDDEEEVDLAFQADDQTLQELLDDIPPEDTFTTNEPSDEDVKRLLEELATSIPQDSHDERRIDDEKEEPDPGEASDSENMKKEVDDVIARYRDEIELEKNQSDDEPPIETKNTTDGPDDAGDLPSLPAVPDSLSSIPSTAAPSDLESLTTRLSALRTSPAPQSALNLPTVPNSKPAKEPRRLKSRTGYTDDDVDSWCTVCLEDATLRCIGCLDEQSGMGEPYCMRCWREMHIGPSAGFEERSHKAVVFNKREGKKVAIGAS